jgi:hypothetical protein
MTFYNLPDTDVKVEYDKNKKLLIISNLPEGYSVTEGYNSEGEAPIAAVALCWDDESWRNATPEQEKVSELRT